MRSLRDQSERELGGRFSVLVRQKRDHAELGRLLAQLEGTPPIQQGTVLRAIYRLVFPHAFAEEGVLWPVIRRVLPEGEALTLQIEQEHQEVNELVTRLEGLTATDPRRAAVLRRLVLVLDEDVRDEEDQLLPRLQARLGPRSLRALGIAWEVMRRTAPTRAHPVVARRPPGNTLAAVPLSVLDRLRDRADALHDRQVAPSTMARVGARLRDAAHRVEGLPLLRRGEDDSTSREW